MRTRRQRQRQWAAALLAITNLCLQNTLIIMAHDREKAHWNEHEVTALIDYLHVHRAEGEAGNFKPKTFNAAADHITPYLSHGPKKVGKMCKTKWASVCYCP